MANPAPATLGQITITVNPNLRQGHETVGDWTLDIPTGSIRASVRVAGLGNADYEFLVALHELVEMWFCRGAAITKEQVDAFDRAWPAVDVRECAACGTKGRCQAGGPGECPRAPYHTQHKFAGMLERVVAYELGIDWTAYEATVERVQGGEAP